MVSYDRPITDRTTFGPLRILLSPGRFDASELDPHLLERTEGSIEASLARHQPDLFIVDARHVGPSVLDALEQPRFQGLPIVLIAGDEDADVAGAMMGVHVAAFLAPDPPAGALAEAVAAAASLSGNVADAGTRYDPQTRIRELQRDAERMAAAIAELAARREGGQAPARPVDAGRIRAHIRARRLRGRFFPEDLFADPAWDMLLDLSAARLEGRQVSVSSLCIAAAVPTTTGLRWIKALVDRNIFERHSDPQDARRAFIAMTPPTAEAMAACLEACFNAPGL